MPTAGITQVFEDAMQAMVDTPPPDEATSIELHADAFTALMATLINPVGTPAALAAGRAAFVAAAQGQSLPPPIGIAAVQGAYVAFVTAWAALTAPYVSTPPAGPPPVATATSLPSYVQVVAEWLATGTAAVPPSSPIPWA
jgi:hypothetical protein